MSALLELRSVTMRFGGLVAVDTADIQVAKGSIHSVIGPNGAGKSTIINMISGIYRPHSGDILFEGRSLLGNRQHQIGRRGIARSFQNTELFHEMTVADNIRVGLHDRNRYGLFSAMTGLRRCREGERNILARTGELLEDVGLTSERDRLAGALPFARARTLEIARALATEPKLLLLDEPAAGLRAGEIDGLVELLCRLRDGGMTILLIDHVMPVVMRVSDRITVMNFGRKIAEGAPSEIRNDPAVIAAYLGH